VVKLIWTLIWNSSFDPEFDLIEVAALGLLTLIGLALQLICPFLGFEMKPFQLWLSFL
jgi:hypothetical protein